MIVNNFSVMLLMDNLQDKCVVGQNLVDQYDDSVALYMVDHFYLHCLVINNNP